MTIKESKGNPLSRSTYLVPVSTSGNILKEGIRGSSTSVTRMAISATGSPVRQNTSRHAYTFKDSEAHKVVSYGAQMINVVSSKDNPLSPYVRKSVAGDSESTRANFQTRTVRLNTSHDLSVDSQCTPVSRNSILMGRQSNREPGPFIYGENTSTYRAISTSRSQMGDSIGKIGQTVLQSHSKTPSHNPSPHPLNPSHPPAMVSATSKIHDKIDIQTPYNPAKAQTYVTYETQNPKTSTTPMSPYNYKGYDHNNYGVLTHQPQVSMVQKPP